MSTELGPRGDLARVRWVAEDGHRLYLEFRNGQTGTVDSDSPFDLSVGSVVLVRATENYLEPVPDDVWPEESWVGVVRLKLSDTTIVESGGHLKLLKTRSGVDYREGNTVEARDSYGIVRVLSEDPIRFLDLPAVDDTFIGKFKALNGISVETFDDFGGLQDVVDRARELIEVPLQHHAALSKIGARPIKGVLFTGPPGTGKTMLARIIANRADAEFYQISGPEVFSKWYGQSEEVKRYFASYSRMLQSRHVRSYSSMKLTVLLGNELRRLTKLRVE
jgi:transitional endoplasmic reticulum ATPase